MHTPHIYLVETAFPHFGCSCWRIGPKSYGVILSCPDPSFAGVSKDIRWYQMINEMKSHEMNRNEMLQLKDIQNHLRIGRSGNMMWANCNKLQLGEMLLVGHGYLSRSFIRWSQSHNRPWERGLPTWKSSKVGIWGSDDKSWLVINIDSCHLSYLSLLIFRWISWLHEYHTSGYMYVDTSITIENNQAISNYIKPSWMVSPRFTREVSSAGHMRLNFVE